MRLLFHYPHKVFYGINSECTSISTQKPPPFDKIFYTYVEKERFMCVLMLLREGYEGARLPFILPPSVTQGRRDSSPSKGEPRGGRGFRSYYTPSVTQGQRDSSPSKGEPRGGQGFRSYYTPSVTQGQRDSSPPKGEPRGGEDSPSKGEPRRAKVVFYQMAGVSEDQCQWRPSAFSSLLK